MLIVRIYLVLLKEWVRASLSKNERGVNTHEDKYFLYRKPVLQTTFSLKNIIPYFKPIQFFLNFCNNEDILPNFLID